MSIPLSEAYRKISDNSADHHNGMTINMYRKIIRAGDNETVFGPHFSVSSRRYELPEK